VWEAFQLFTSACRSAEVKRRRHESLLYAQQGADYSAAAQ
jgi:hypothetical protein